MQGSQNSEICRRDNFVAQEQFEVIGCEISSFLAEMTRAKNILVIDFCNFGGS